MGGLVLLVIWKPCGLRIMNNKRYRVFDCSGSQAVLRMVKHSRAPYNVKPRGRKQIKNVGQRFWKLRTYGMPGFFPNVLSLFGKKFRRRAAWCNLPARRRHVGRRGALSQHLRVQLELS